MPAKRPTTDDLRARIAVSPGEAAQLLGIDRRTFYRRIMPAVELGAIQSLRIGRARRILVTSLIAWVQAEAERPAA
jgi:excisionase family DNA binding protein